MNKLSRRLETIISMVPANPEACVADVGTDHGFVPVNLILRGKAGRVLATDIGRGPLMRAEEHIRASGLEKRIATRLSDGLDAIEPGEADGVVIAGMGGDLMLRILTKAGPHRERVNWWVLSPQSELSRFRHGLEGLGLAIAAERMLCEDGKYYVVMFVQPGRMHYEREYQYRYGDCLLRERSPLLREYLRREKRQLAAILSGLSSCEGRTAANRAAELKEKLCVLEEAENAYDALQ